MKYSIVTKFLAIVLAAVALLTVAGSAAGIIVLASGELYERSVEDLREEQAESIRREFAVNQIHRYASLHLGNLPESYLQSIFGNQWYYTPFTYDTYYYTIRNEFGEIVESTLKDGVHGAKCYEIVVTDMRYRRAAPENPDEDSTIVDPNARTSVEADTDETVDAVTAEDPTEKDTVFPTDETCVDESEPISADGSVAQSDESEVMTAQAQRSSVDEEVYTAWYYDYTLDKDVEIRWQTASLPAYTLELYLLPGAMPDEAVWTLLETVWNIRMELFYILVAALLVLAVALVYLCCVAGRKEAGTQPRAEGVNRLPLDLYLVLDVCMVAIGITFGILGAEWLVEQSLELTAGLLGLDGFFCAAGIVCFFFALCAQMKMPDGYWWKNTVTVRAVHLAILTCKKAGHVLCWVMTHIPACVCALCAQTKRFIAFLLRPVARLARWIGERITRVYALLPLMWQWVVTGAVLLLFMVIAVIAMIQTNGLLVFLCLAACAAIVLYGAYSFGVLLEGVARMSKGNLDTKVDDGHLVGAFKEFSDDLNALSEVATVAAQKQMKAERMKTELITNVSHDIKTPLTSIINYVDLLEKPHTEQEQTQYLEVLSRQSQRLKKLIDDLMEMSKASTGNLSVDITEVNAVEAINQAVGEFADKLERSELTPIFRVPQESIMMRADGRLVWRVLSNLLGNAVKYALPGTRLYIDLMHMDGKVIISLKNISRDALNVNAEELLERFVRGDSSRNTEGSGLGLNIAQSLMELQKGQLQLLVDGDLFKVTLTFPAA